MKNSLQHALAQLIVAIVTIELVHTVGNFKGKLLMSYHVEGDPNEWCKKVENGNWDKKIKMAIGVICDNQSIYFGIASILFCVQVNKAENISNLFIPNNLPKIDFFLDHFGCFVRILFHRIQSQRPEIRNYIF